MNNDVWEENYFNADMLSAAGVTAPQTWDDLITGLRS